MESAAFIQWCLNHLNYWTITILMALESSLFPLPSEIVVPPAAWKSVVGNQLNIYLVVLFATLGCDIGASVNYFLAQWLGRPIVYKFANSKIGHLLLLNQEKLDKTVDYFQKRGAIATFTGRLLPVIRHLISIPAGISKMHYGAFILYTTIGSAIWNSILALMGYYCSKIPGIETEEQLIETVTHYSHEIGYTLLGLIILAIGYKIYKSRKKKRRMQAGG